VPEEVLQEDLRKAEGEVGGSELGPRPGGVRGRIGRVEGETQSYARDDRGYSLVGRVEEDELPLFGAESGRESLISISLAVVAAALKPALPCDVAEEGGDHPEPA